MCLLAGYLIKIPSGSNLWAYRVGQTQWEQSKTFSNAELDTHIQLPAQTDQSASNKYLLQFMIHTIKYFLRIKVKVFIWFMRPRYIYACIICIIQNQSITPNTISFEREPLSNSFKVLPFSKFYELQMFCCFFHVYAFIQE